MNRNRRAVLDREPRREGAGMRVRSRALILADLGQILGNFQGREYSAEIGPETRFFGDLGLASIDAVVLGETLQSHYGRSLPFGDLMADLGRRSDRDLSVGELVEFLHLHLVQSEESEGSAPSGGPGAEGDAAAS
jgi:acyl carrier protein